MKNADILRVARERMGAAVTADEENRNEALDDLAKLTGDQWPEEIKTERETDNKPCLTLNRLPQFVRQVTGDIRRMNPALNIIPANQEASKETAEIVEGLVRQIEYRSDASSVYEQTAEQAAASSIGSFRILSDYEDDDTFDQEILIKRIRNSFSVYYDPSAQMPTREDGNWTFITEQMSAEDFDRTYPKKGRVDAEHDGTTDGLEYWHHEGRVVVAEYYWKEPVSKTIWLMADGTIREDEPQIPEYSVRKREVKTHQIKWAKISGDSVLEGPKDIPGKIIPVVAITGEEWHVGEKVHRSSVIRYAKDAQQMYNLWRSASTEVVALQPKAPYMVTAKQIAGLETLWGQANQKNRPYLVYNPDEKAGPPSRSAPPVASQGMMTEIMAAAEDMKATTGIYDAGLGNASTEKSGVAIRQRQMESDVSTSIYSDNMAKAIATCGRIIIGMIPSIYDTQRVIRILGKDEKESMVLVNRVIGTPTGEEIINDLKVGKYDVRVSVGPNYSTRRQETSEGMLEFARTFPAAAAVTSDLIAKAQDWPDADLFAERLKKTLPPGVIELEDMEPEEQQQIQGQMQQAQEQQQQQQEFAQVMQRAEATKATAEADEAEADATKLRLAVAKDA